MRKINIPSFTMCIFALLLSTTHAYSSSVDFEDYMPDSRNVILIQDSPQDDLRWAYDQIRQRSNFDDFIRRSNRFEDYILDPIDMNNIPDQTEYIDEAISLKDNLINSHLLVNSFFDKYIKKLNHRINLAKIDQQIFNANGIKGNFNHPDIPQNMRDALSGLVGKVFHITQEKDEPEEVSKVGSGIFASQNQNGLQDIGQNTSLNRIFTCAHVLEANEDEHIIGAYFVPNDSLDPLTGFPLDLNNPVNTSNDLIDYLRANPNSFQISDYTIRKRTGINTQLFPNNKLQVTKPQYWDNEDIVLGILNNNQPYRVYQHNIAVNFDITKNQPIPAFNNGDSYFAIGYPGCPHYSKEPFRNRNYNNLLLPINAHPQLALINDVGFSPLVVTSSQARNQIDPVNKRPFFNEGLVKHEAPTAKGMSGGTLITIKNNQIYFLGCITGGTIDEKEACY